MANWENVKSRGGNVKDRRGMAPVAGGIGLGGIALIIGLNLLTGGGIGDIAQDLFSVAQQTQTVQVENPDQYEGEDSYEVFASTVLGSNNKLWREEFANRNATYSEPTLVLFRQATQSACGGANSAVGPHYCPIDKTIYLDETFFDELSRRFGAEGGDVAEAYVMSHEVAHHAQNELGIMDQANRRDNESSIAIELQADCFAGVWANSIRDQQVFEPGEIKEAMDAAAAVGDDRIQESINGQVNPESWTHGSSEQRVEWFMRGYQTGSIDSCDTFSS